MQIIKENQYTPLGTGHYNRDPFLVIEEVSKVYPSKTGASTVLERVNLTVYEGEFICDRSLWLWQNHFVEHGVWI